MPKSSVTITTERTPNPNAIRCGFDVPIGTRVRSYFSAQDASEDELALRLFAIEGVTNVLIHTQFVSIVKAPDVPWSSVRPRVLKILRTVPALSDAPATDG